jgi:hypothetical protein
MNTLLTCGFPALVQLYVAQVDGIRAIETYEALAARAAHDHPRCSPFINYKFGWLQASLK